MENYCVNCKWFARSQGYDWCDNPKLGINIVTGIVEGTSPGYTRNRKSQCGPEGKWFEEKITLFGKIKQYFSIKEGR